MVCIPTNQKLETIHSSGHNVLNQTGKLTQIYGDLAAYKIAKRWHDTVPMAHIYGQQPHALAQRTGVKVLMLVACPHEIDANIKDEEIILSIRSVILNSL